LFDEVPNPRGISHCSLDNVIQLHSKNWNLADDMPQILTA
jgi:hypothetical protein